MGVLQPRSRRDSRASALSRRDWGFNRERGLSMPEESSVEHATLDSSPAAGLEASSQDGNSLRTPSRSFHHRSVNASAGRYYCAPVIVCDTMWAERIYLLTTRRPLDPAQYASDGLREQTAELATYGLSMDNTSSRGRRSLPPSLETFQEQQQPAGPHHEIGGTHPTAVEDTLASGSVPVDPTFASSALTEMIRQPSRETAEDWPKPSVADDASTAHLSTILDEPEPRDTERTSLLSKTRSKSSHHYGAVEDVESQGGALARSSNALEQSVSSLAKGSRIVLNPKSWDKRAIWQEGVVYPASLIPAVFLGLLLNVLDALSYGMILFPLGEPLFAHLGADGISMYYVSTIVAQVVFSCGGSIFKGGIGSEMIEVVPFFHQMAFTIMNKVGKDNPQSVIATTILAFSVSSVLTGLVFFLMGICGLGSLIGFFPRHILIGCIGGVGYFLLQTGVEVSARLPGSLEYNFDTLQKLFHLDTLPLWMIPLFLAIGLLVLKRFIRSNFLVGGYFIGVATMFYIVVLIARIPMDTLHQRGWVFDAPSSNDPWYHFYTLYGKCLATFILCG